MNSSIFPKHVAIIMDGNGRWAKQRCLPRVAGHKAGLEAAHKVVEYSIEKNLQVLSLFVFSSENWGRPQDEVSYLMNLFMTMLKRDAKKLHDKNVQLRVIGDRHRFSPALKKSILKVEKLTANNTGLKLLLAVNYGGQWDITQAVQHIVSEIEQGHLDSKHVTGDTIAQHLSFADLPNPDLFIRTSGEMRISNFMLWQLAYAELYFTEVYWPDFDATAMEQALIFFASRERRFGHISEQLKEEQYA